MNIRNIYKEKIDRAVNPAVSATKLDKETREVEIREYVFTDEIMNGLYRILNAIKNNKFYDHVGIWIDGYYGSGKSHFLKYLDYCITPETQDEALDRFMDAIDEIDPLDDSLNLEFSKEDFSAIAKWLKRATVDTCIFNLETSYDQSTDKKDAFLQVFWSEFNKLRGFNEFNITLAQSLEKPLQEKGVFDAFKKKIADEGGNWDVDAADIVDNELQWVLDIAKDLAPTLDIDSIRKRILNRDTNMSIKNFARELNSYLDGKGEDYRLILLVDEVSQFINKERDRYLNLQEIITHLSEACGNRVWIACTAQQDLSEVLEDCNVNEGVQNMGKILGRFEVKVSLKGTQPEVITQKRILDKNEAAKAPLTALYKKEENGFSQRFALPASYNGYTSVEDFIAYYPFVPYQFKLIMQVFNNFLNLGYVAKEVKGNERSIIKVVHSTARKNADKELGSLISFDQFYDNMFETGLQARGQKAIQNAEKMALEYTENPRFAKRVVNVLFMICNISDTDKLIFPATIQNITTLLLNDFTTPFLNLKEEVKKVVEFLCEKNVIREEKPRKGLEPFYSFYSEEEMKVAELIKSQNIDLSFQADQMRDIIQKYLTSMRPKIQYKTRDFAVGGSVMQRNFMSNTPDVSVEFYMDPDCEVEDMILRNVGGKLMFLCGKAYHADRKLVNDFAWYCRVQKYAEVPVANEENAKVREEFGKRAAESLTANIIPKIREILDTCPVMSGCNQIDDMLLAGKKGPDRYNAAMQYHLGSIYTRAGMVDSGSVPRDTATLKAKILRRIQPGDYQGVDAALSPAEQEVEVWLAKQGGLDVNLNAITSKFAQAPYGWHDVCTMYVVNELVRRHRRDFLFANNPNVEPQTVASRIVTETNKFSVREGKAISQDLINKFVDAWKKVFGMSAQLGSTDSAQMFRTAQDWLAKLIENYGKLLTEYGSYGFSAPLSEAVALSQGWNQIRDHSKFFQKVIDESDKASAIMDACKEVNEFVKDQIQNFKKVVRYADDNRDNFRFLSEELQIVATELRELRSKPWPFKIRDYIKKMNEVDKALNVVRENIREEIKAEYIKTYDLLRDSAEAEGVKMSIVAEPEAIYTSKCASSNILLLKGYVNTDEYFAREAEKIQLEKQRMSMPKPAPGAQGAGTPTAPKPYPVSVNMKLDTRVVGLSNEAEVDAYLARLKEKIMSKIADNKVVTIIN